MLNPATMHITRTPFPALLLALLSTACLAQGGGSLTAGGRGGAPTGNEPTPGAAGEPEGGYGGPAGGMDGGSTAAPAAGPVEPRWDDFAFAVRERSSTYWAPWVITKLTTFKVGAACYAKLGAKDSGSLNNTPYYTRSVHDLAKQWTTEDWEAIESQRGERAKDRALVEPMIAEFGKRFHMTIAVEGDDCETERDTLWVRYWYTIAEAFEKYPPISGKLFVTLNVSATARDVKVDVDESGSSFTFTAPRDIEAKGWHEKVEKPFRKHAGKL